MRSIIPPNSHTKSILFFTTLVVACSPFIFIHLEKTYVSPIGTPLCMHVLYGSMYFFGEFVPVIFKLHPSVLPVLFILYVVFIFLFIIIGVGVIRITQECSIRTQRIVLLLWLVIYI